MRLTIRSIAAFLLLSTTLLVGATPLFAQVKSFASYLEKLSVPTSVLSDAVLLNAHSDSLDNASDIHLLQAQLDTYVKALKTSNTFFNSSGSKVGNTRLNAQPKGKKLDSNRVIPTGEPMMLAVAFGMNSDSCTALAKAVQELKNTYEVSYRGITDAYNYRVKVAIEKSNRLQQKEPCGSDQNCFRAHRLQYNKELLDASKDRIGSNLPLIASQLHQLKPLLARIDAYVPKEFPASASVQTRRALNGLIDNTKNILLAVSEQITLQRVFTAECAKLIQQK